MKKISIFLATAAIAALASVSCNKELSAPVESVSPKVSVRISGAPKDAAEVDPTTRTFISETGSGYVAKWGNSGEALGVILGDVDDKVQPAILEAEPTTDNDPIFTGEITAEDNLPGETYNIFVFYPASAFGTGYNDGGLGFDLKKVQNPVLGSFDPSCDLMGYSSDDAVVANGSLVLEGIALQRPMAILRINLNADNDAKAFGQKVSSLKMQLPSDLILTGRAKISAAGMDWNQSLKCSYVKAEIDLGEEITVGESDGFNAVYLVVNPLLIPAGTEINFIVETEDYNGTTAFNRTVTAPSDMQLQAGNVNVIDLKLRDKDLPTVSDKSYLKVTSDSDLEDGQYLIVYEEGSRAFNGGLSTLDATSNYIEVVIEDDAIPSTTVTDAAAFTIEAMEGGYSILSASGKYICQTANSNGLVGRDEAVANSISIEESGDADIACSGNHLRYNATSGQDRFRYFKSSSYSTQKPVALYRLDVAADPTPKITFEGDENGNVEKTVPASTTTVEFAYSKNKYVTELPTATKVGGLYLFDGNPVVTDGKVTVNILPSTEETERRIIVKMTGQGISDEGVFLNIVQEAYVPAATSEDDPYSVAEAVEAAQELDADGSVENVYVKGIISRIATAYSSQHNNVSFYISDDGTTGGTELQIFRLPATSEADYTVGDAVEIKGVLKNFQGNSPELAATFEVVYAYKAPSFSPAPGIYTSAQNVTITSTDGTPIYYTVDGSTPTTSSSVYSSPISVSESMTIKAFTIVNGVSTGVVTADYTIDAQGNDGSLEHPFTASEAAALALAGNTSTVYVVGIISSIATAFNSTYSNVSFYITDDGLDSSDKFEIFRAAATSADDYKVGDWVKFQGKLTKYNTTPETEAAPTLISQIHAPSFSPADGSFSTASLSVTITADSDSQIYYTTDESVPTATTGTLYTSAISISSSTVIKAFAVKDGVSTGVVSKTYTKVSSGSATATLIFNTDAGISALGITKPNPSAGTDLVGPYTVDDVTMTVGHGSTKTRVWNASGTLELRIYKNGSLAFSVPAGKNITKIELSGSAVSGFTVTDGTFSSGTWTGSANSITLTASGTGKINTIAVTYE